MVLLADSRHSLCIDLITGEKTPPPKHPISMTNKKKH